MGVGTKIDNMSKCMQYALIIANVIFFICGLCAIGIGAWVVADHQYVQHLLDTNDSYTSAAYILIVIGVIVAIISFLGCFGAMKQNKCLLMLYAISLCIIFALFLTAAILGFVYKDKVKDTMKDELMKTMDKYEDETAMMTAWDDAQKGLKCCGVNGYDDWDNKLESKDAPKSCCKSESEDCTSKANKDKAFSDGCEDKFKEMAKEGAIVAGVVAIVIALLLILGIIFSCCLYKSIDEMV